MWMNNYTKQNKPEKTNTAWSHLYVKYKKNEIKIACTEMVVACA